MLFLFKLSIINHLVDTITKRKSLKKRTKFCLVGMCSNLFMKEKTKFKNNNMRIVHDDCNKNII
jgi:hypothetical protein